MHLPKRDVIATCLVAVAVVLYLVWAIGSTLPGMSGARVTGMAVLALGFAASAAAVVPGFDQLVHGSKTYLAVTSIIGLAAVAAGVHMLVTASGVSLTLVMAAMAVLWLIATIHHSLLATAGPILSDGRLNELRYGCRNPREEADFRAGPAAAGQADGHPARPQDL